MFTYRVFVHDGQGFKYTAHTVQAHSVKSARAAWTRIGSPSETRRFRVSKETEIVFRPLDDV